MTMSHSCKPCSMATRSPIPVPGFRSAARRRWRRLPRRTGRTGSSRARSSARAARPAARRPAAGCAIFVRQQGQVGIGARRPRGDRSGGGVDRIVEERQRARVAPSRILGQAHLDLDLAHRPAPLDGGEVALARAEGHADRIDPEPVADELFLLCEGAGVSVGSIGPKGPAAPVRQTRCQPRAGVTLNFVAVFPLFPSGGSPANRPIADGCVTSTCLFAARLRVAWGP